jgi:hypothetical protein
LKSTLSLAAAVLALLLSLFALSGMKHPPAPAAPWDVAAAPAPAAPDASEELRALRAEVADLKRQVAEMAGRPAPTVAAAPADPDQESMLKEMKRMWKGREGGSGHPVLSSENLELGGEGPVLKDTLVQTLDLQTSQTDAINAILQAAYKEFLALEAQHTSIRKADDGRLRVTVSDFNKEGRAIEEHLWMQLDGSLNEQQRKLARREMSVASAFGNFGAGTRTIDLWQEDGFYRHTENRKDGRSSWSSSGGADQVPAQYKRFWKE